MFLDEIAHEAFKRTKRESLRFASCLETAHPLLTCYLYRFALMAGSAMPKGLLDRVMSEFPVSEVFTNWGMTELSSVATMTSRQDPIQKVLQTSGQPLPNTTVRIVNPGTGETVPWGSKGEITVAGFGVMHSYYGDRVKTDEAVRLDTSPLSGGTARRWMFTGDEGLLDADGFVVITGRIKDLIIKGGENISPLEIEARLAEHPAIQQAAAFGVASVRYGEEVGVVIEAKNDITQRPTQQQIREWIGLKLSRYKAPTHVWWLGDVKAGMPEEWPKTANGKLRKKDIKALADKALAEGKSHIPTISAQAPLAFLRRVCLY